MKIVITANTSFNLLNFRAGLIRALQVAGHDVVALAPVDEYTDALRSDLGCEFVELKIDPRGTSLPREVATLFGMIAAIRRLKPDVILSYTIKNNLYGGMASRLTGVPIIPNITGLGSLFSGDSFLGSVARIMYRQAFALAPVVFFQNVEDRDLFLSMGTVDPERAGLLPGSGVDLAKFGVTPVPDHADAPVFLLVGRMLWEKGIGEFIEAARQVRLEFPHARFRIAGATELESEAAVPRSVIDGWAEEGLVEYLGRVRDIRPEIANATCVVLPSYYREGTPRALLEAAASGRPIITTDTAGCRTVVRNGESGLLVSPRDTDDLARAMLKICRASHSELVKMGAEGRSHIVDNFDERLVIRAYRDAIEGIGDTARRKGWFAVKVGAGQGPT